jgi:hypothetical protein
MRYSDYVGNDSTSVFGTWQNSRGTMADTERAVPIYRGWPDRPYKVIGSLRLSNPDQVWDEGDFAAAARRAKRRGGNAIIIRRGSEFGVSKIAGARDDERSIRASSYTSALVIQWLTEKDVKDMENTVEKMISDYQRAAYPNSGLNHTLARLVFAYLVRSGSDLHDLPGFYTQFSDTMKKLRSEDATRIEGTWFYKVLLSSGTAISGEEEHDYLGLATVSLSGDKLALVSREGALEVNFSGVLGDGSLTGQLGIGPYTAKCEGAVTSDKISISFQSRNADGVIRGNMVLQRLLKP